MLANDGTFGLSRGEMLWLEENYPSNDTARHIVALLGEAAGQGADAAARQRFADALRDFRDSDEYTGVLTRAFTA